MLIALVGVVLVVLAADVGILTPARRPRARRRWAGRTVGAVGAIAAGFVLGWVGYVGLALGAILLVATAVLAPLGRTRPAH